MHYNSIGDKPSRFRLEVIAVPLKPKAFRIEHAINLYVSGRNAKQASVEAHINYENWAPELKQRGLMRPKGHQSPRAAAARRAKTDIRLNISMPEMIVRYLAGESAYALGASYGTNEMFIRRRLRLAGIPLRNIVESHALHTPLQRATYARPAHFFLGKGEAELADMLAARGHRPERQVIVEPFNLDMAFNNVAIEVHANDNPLAPTSREMRAGRLEKLLDRGWHVVYVWHRTSCPLTDAAADYVVSFIEQASLDPTARREYAVVRGCGELLARGEGKPEPFLIKSYPGHRHSVGGGDN